MRKCGTRKEAITRIQEAILGHLAARFQVQRLKRSKGSETIELIVKPFLHLDLKADIRKRGKDIGVAIPASTVKQYGPKAGQRVRFRLTVERLGNTAPLAKGRKASPRGKSAREPEDVAPLSGPAFDALWSNAKDRVWDKH